MRFNRRELLLGAAAMGLAACAPRTPQARGLELWTLQLAPKFNPYFADVLGAWSRLHPDAPVRWTDLPWGSVERKLLAAVFAHCPGCGEPQSPFAANLASKGGLADLTPLLPADCRRRYLPRCGRPADPDAGQIAVPWYLTVRLSLVNRALLDEAGIAEPPTRWDQVPAFARRIRQRTGRYGLFLTTVPDDSAELLETLVQMGVTLLDPQRRAAFDSPAGRRAFRFWSDLYQEGLLPREVVSQGQRRAIELFQSGDLALAATGAEFLRSIQTNAPRVAAFTEPHPPVTGPDGTANVALMTLAVPRQSRRTQAALDLALFLTNADHQARFAAEARVLPSSLEALARVRAELEQEMPASAAERQIRQARLLSASTLDRARVLVPALPGIKRLQKIIYTQMQRAMLAQVSPEQALTNAASEWNLYASSRWPEASENY